MPTMTRSDAGEMTFDLSPTILSAELHADACGFSPEKIGFFWHRPKLKPRIVATVRNSGSVDRHVVLHAHLPKLAWQNERLTWLAPFHAARQLEGGDAVEAQDSIIDAQTLRLYVRAGHVRRVTLELDLKADGETFAGETPLQVDGTVEANGDQRSTQIRDRIALLVVRPETALLDHLPGIYREAMMELREHQNLNQESPFFERYLLGFEDVITPLRETLNSLEQLFGAFSTPSYMVLWLATWVTMPMDENWPDMKRRKLVSEAVELFRWRGTRRCLQRFIEIYTGFIPEIDDRPILGMRLGPLAQLRTTGAVLGDIGPHTFLVTLAIPSGALVNESIVRDIIDFAKPAHTSYSLRIIERARPVRDVTYVN